MTVSGPTVIRRQLGRRLQRLREQAGYTHDDVQAAQLGSRTKLWRVETGQLPVRVADVVAWCRLYGVDDDTAEQLTALAAATSQQNWWEDHGDAVPAWFRLYVGLEATAATIRTVEDTVVPGEYQTADYARAVYQAARPEDCAEDIERRVKVRLERQDSLLRRAAPPDLVVVLGENVLTRMVGGPDVLNAQIAHLRTLDEHGVADILVLPHHIGAHAAMTGAFRILEFDDPDDPDVVYLETQVGAHYLEKPPELSEYHRLFDLVRKQAVPIGDYS